jgi:uncharacterized protein
MASKNKGLYFTDIDDKNKLLIDSDNVFWGIIKDFDSNSLIPGKLLSLYEKLKEKCGAEMNNFRFNLGLNSVYIDPTDRCNANCPYCYVPSDIRTKGRSMTEEELVFILEKISKHFKGSGRKPVIIFHASEPLLVKDIVFAAIKKFKDKFYFGIQTNAILLEKEDVKFIKEHKVSIGISLDAADLKTNNLLRYSAKEGGNFKKAVQAIEWFRGYNGLNVITTITKYNVTKLPDMIKFLHKKKVNCVLMNPVRLTQKNSRGIRPDDKAMAKYFIKAVEESLKLSAKSKHKIIIGNFTNIILAVIAPTARRLMCDISPCGGGRCFFTITAKGEMIPCGEFIGIKGSSGGNIFKDSIDSAMNSKPFKEIRQRIVEDIPECDVCILRNICGAPCPAELKSLGNIRKKSVFCEFYKETIKYAFKLIAEGKEKQLIRNEVLKNIRYEYLLEP